MSVTLPSPYVPPRTDAADLGASPPRRRRRVDLLREEVSRGTYRVDVEALAVRLLASGDLGIALPPS